MNVKKIITKYLITMCLLLLSSTNLWAQTTEKDTIAIDSILWSPYLPIKNVVITNEGSLTIKSLSSVVLGAGFEVNVGGEFEVTHPSELLVTYTYDLSGNRIRRRIEEQNQ